jgi:hypothetical protein
MNINCAKRAFGIGTFLMMLCCFSGCGQTQRSAFQFQQQISIASQKSEADVREQVEIFIQETEGDSEVEFSTVKYYKEGFWNPIYYADVICNVKRLDSTLGNVMARTLRKLEANKKSSNN